MKMITEYIWKISKNESLQSFSRNWWRIDLESVQIESLVRKYVNRSLILHLYEIWKKEIRVSRVHLKNYKKNCKNCKMLNLSVLKRSGADIQ